MKLPFLCSVLAATTWLAPHARAQFELQTFFPDDVDTAMFFGNAMDLSGDRVIVGAFNAFSGRGMAYIFELDGGTWVQTASLAASDSFFGDAFGTSVSISGFRAVVGAPRNDDFGAETGAAYVFERTPSGWVETQKLASDDIEGGDEFGAALVLEGERLLIGAPGEGSQFRRGAAYVFELEGSTWVQQQKLTASDGTLHDEFGNALDLSGETALIGAWKDNPPGIPNTGSVYVFEESGGAWSESVKLTASDPAALDFFGRNVELEDDTAMIANERDTVYVFRRVGTSWMEGEHLVPTDQQPILADFGASISLAGEWLAVGAPRSYFLDRFVGVTYLFRDKPPGWEPVNRLVRSDGVQNDRFGGAVAVGGIAALVGADGADDQAPGAGAAYFFPLQELAASSYCFCPAEVAICGNLDLDGGCANSTGAGARIAAVGSSSIARDNLAIAGAEMPPDQFGIFYMGAGQTDLPFGDGRRCVAAGGVGTFRFPIQSTGPEGRLQLGPDIVLHSTTQFPASGHISAGQTWNFQAWFRDPTGPCGNSFNLSNGLSVVFAP